MKKRVKRLAVGAAVGAVLLIAGLLVFQSDSATKAASTEAAGHSASAASQAQAAAFPWDRASQAAAATPPPTASPASMESVEINDALLTIDPPSKPVWMIVDAYRKTQASTLKQKMEVLAALSYCENKRPLIKILAEERSRGESTKSSSEELEKSRELCGQVPDSAYTLRRDILQEAADAGSVQAMLSFFDTGPLGRWPGADEYVPLTKVEIADWQKKGIAYLEKAASLGSVEAYKALSGIYAPRTAGNGAESYQSAATSYAYDYVWASAKLLSHDLSAEAKQQVHSYLKNQESLLTAEQMKEGRKQAKTIVSNSKQSNSTGK